MTAKLVVVPPQKTRLDQNVVEVSGAVYPKGFTVSRVTGQRRLKKGEITRFIKQCVELFFTEGLNAEDRHRPVDLYLLKMVIAPDIEGWVRNFSGNPHFKILPWKLSQAIRTMEINGVKFRIEGQAIQLPESAQDNIEPKLELRRGVR